MEWWYFTGRLRSVDASVRGSGYQFTFVRLGMRQCKTRISL